MAPFNSGPPMATITILLCIIPPMAFTLPVCNQLTYPSLTHIISSQQCQLKHLTQGHMDFRVSLLAQEVSFTHKIMCMTKICTLQLDPITIDPTSNVEITTISTLVTTTMKATILTIMTTTITKVILMVSINQRIVSSRIAVILTS